MTADRRRAPGCIGDACGPGRQLCEPCLKAAERWNSDRVGTSAVGSRWKKKQAGVEWALCRDCYRVGFPDCEACVDAFGPKKPARETIRPRPDGFIDELLGEIGDAAHPVVEKARRYTPLKPAADIPPGQLCAHCKHRPREGRYRHCSACRKWKQRHGELPSPDAAPDYLITPAEYDEILRRQRPWMFAKDSK